MTQTTVSGTTSIVANALERLAMCLCAQIVADGSPQPCFCGVSPGTGFSPDLIQCDTEDACGVAFVQLSNSYPSQTVGVADQSPGNCGDAIGFDAVIGILRCFPLQPDGSNPPPDVQLQLFRQQMLDMETMRRALTCCDWLPSKNVVVGQYTPVGPEGELLGGSFTVFGQVFG